jgi:two-component system sensor histidine kinase AlgZ
VCLGAFWVCWAAPLSGSLLRVAASHLLAAVICASLLLEGARGWAGLLARTDYFGPGLTRHASAIAPLLLGLGLVLYLFAAALHYMLIAFERSRHAETEALQAQILSREAELRALRAQIQPHFLFNSLNSINALVGSRPEEARRVCVLLADFLLRTLVVGTRERVPLSEELTLVDDLLSIERVRFGDRLRYECSVEEGTASWQVPPLVLQPLVENAVKHGLSPSAAGGTVWVVARVEDGRLLLTVRDDGVGPNGGVTAGTGTGLSNVRARLTGLYGDRQSFSTAAAPDGGTIVRLTLPVSADDARG